MIIRKYGVELRSLTEEDLQLVLQWRNDPEVRQFMLYQHEITEEEHRSWFETLAPFAHYFIILWEGEKVGVCNIKSIDMDDRCAEAGIFLGVPTFHHSYVPMLAILALMDLCLDDFGFNYLTARVRKENAAALRMNQDLGYQLIDLDDDAYLLRVYAEDYRRQRQRFAQFLQKFTQAEAELSLSPEEAAFFRPVK